MCGDDLMKINKKNIFYPYTFFSSVSSILKLLKYTYFSNLAPLIYKYIDTNFWYYILHQIWKCVLNNGLKTAQLGELSHKNFYYDRKNII